jgi:hypothetical protein
MPRPTRHNRGTGEPWTASTGRRWGPHPCPSNRPPLSLPCCAKPVAWTPAAASAPLFRAVCCHPGRGQEPRLATPPRGNCWDPCVTLRLSLQLCQRAWQSSQPLACPICGRRLVPRPPLGSMPFDHRELTFPGVHGPGLAGGPPTVLRLRMMPVPSPVQPAIARAAARAHLRW